MWRNPQIHTTNAEKHQEVVERLGDQKPMHPMQFFGCIMLMIRWFCHWFGVQFSGIFRLRLSSWVLKHETVSLQEVHWRFNWVETTFSSMCSKVQWQTSDNLVASPKRSLLFDIFDHAIPCQSTLGVLLLNVTGCDWHVCVAQRWIQSPSPFLRGSLDTDMSSGLKSFGVAPGRIFDTSSSRGNPTEIFQKDVFVVGRYGFFLT